MPCVRARAMRIDTEKKYGRKRKMEHAWDKAVKTVTAVAGVIVGYWGGWPPLLRILVVAVMLDYFSGLVVAVKGKSNKSETGGISSKAGFFGLVGKVFIFAIVYMAGLVDEATGTAVIQTAVMFFYIANEGISLLENAALMGVWVPEVLKKALEVMREKGEAKDGSAEEEELNRE